MSATRLLVISENQELSHYLQQRIKELPDSWPVTADFCYTALNSNPDEMIKLGARRIDMANEREIDPIIESYDLVFSLHCKQVFPKRLVESICCINFHPGFNPYNRGWFPQAFSIINGLPIGCTIHLMDERIDHGSIIDQEAVDISPGDTSLEVYRKIIATEKRLIKKNLAPILEGSFQTRPPASVGNYNSQNDYRALCELDLTAVASLADHINLLRATSHGEFNNAWFQGADGNRYFIRVIIQKGAEP